MKYAHIPGAVCLAMLTACAGQYTPMSFAVRGDQIVASGVIDGSTLAAFQEVTAQNPGIKTLVLRAVDGSADDDANVILGRVVHNSGFDTIVPSDGLIASGGTDLFLAGHRRVLQSGACVGVHSWSAADVVATDLPKNDPEHLRYLDYYRDINVDEEFYWFTLEAAPADGMHWMTAAEAEGFDMTTRTTSSLGSASACVTR